MTASAGQPNTTAARALITLCAAAIVVIVGLVAFVVSGAAIMLAGSSTLIAGAPGDGQLNVDAIPSHARFLAAWVMRAGSTCPQITAPMVAAQLDLESSWNANAVAHNPAADGG